MAHSWTATGRSHLSHQRAIILYGVWVLVHFVGQSNVALWVGSLESQKRNMDDCKYCKYFETKIKRWVSETENPLKLSNISQTVLWILFPVAAQNHWNSLLVLQSHVSPLYGPVSSLCSDRPSASFTPLLWKLEGQGLSSAVDKRGSWRQTVRQRFEMSRRPPDSQTVGTADRLAVGVSPLTRPDSFHAGSCHCEREDWVRLGAFDVGVALVFEVAAHFAPVCFF